MVKRGRAGGREEEVERGTTDHEETGKNDTDRMLAVDHDQEQVGYIVEILEHWSELSAGRAPVGGEVVEDQVLGGSERRKSWSSSRSINYCSKE